MLRLGAHYTYNLRGGNDRGPTEKSKMNRVLNLNDPMPGNKCQKADKSQNSYKNIMLQS